MQSYVHRTGDRYALRFSYNGIGTKLSISSFGFLLASCRYAFQIDNNNFITIRKYNQNSEIFRHSE